LGPGPCGREIQSCSGDTRMRILGRRKTKYGIILNWKKYEMRAWTGFMWLEIGTVEAFLFRTTVTNLPEL